MWIENLTLAELELQTLEDGKKDEIPSCQAVTKQLN